MVDLKIERNFKIQGVDFSIYCDINNLFNIKNFNVTDFGEAIYEGADYYQSPGNASYTFAAFGKDATEEFNRYMTRIQQTGKKPGKNRISEDDWNSYVDAVRRETARRQPAKHLKQQKETDK